jgi:hypothetical protein
VGVGVAYYFHGRSTLPTSEPTAVPPQAASSEPPIEHPLPSSATSSSIPLPSLNDSDPALKDALSALVGANAMQYVVPEDIVRHVVVTIDNLPRQKAPAAKRPTVAVQGPFLVEGDEVHATLDPKNFARYDPMVNVVRQLDMQRVADTYFHFYPLFQSAYQNLGYPNGYFNDRLVQVIDSLLATPKPSGPIELTRPNVLYTYADPKLEALPAGEKLLLRMGSDNAAVIKGKLKELRAIITAAPPKH